MNLSKQICMILLALSVSPLSEAAEYTIKGDIRYRYENREDDGVTAKSRERIRARIGVYGDATETIKFGTRIATGGTGLTGRDGTPEAFRSIFEKEIEGFGEIFRYLSFKKIKTSTIQSRAVAGVANSTYIFCLPGSPSACKDAWVDIIQHQLDSTNKPCNLVELMPRLKD